MAADSAPDAPDWLGACRRAARRDPRHARRAPDDRRARRARRARAARAATARSLIDEAAEDVVFAELDALHAAGARFTAISEERGVVDFGGDGHAAS